MGTQSEIIQQIKFIEEQLKTDNSLLLRKKRTSLMKRLYRQKTKEEKGISLGQINAIVRSRQRLVKKLESQW